MNNFILYYSEGKFKKSKWGYELFRNSRVEVNFTFEEESDGIVEDKGGFNNIGIFISDYRVKFNDSTREPEDTDVVSDPTLDLDEKAF